MGPDEPVDRSDFFFPWALLGGQVGWLIVATMLSRGFLPGPQPWFEGIAHELRWLATITGCVLIYGFPVAGVVLLTHPDVKRTALWRRGVIWLVEALLVCSYFLILLNAVR